MAETCAIDFPPPVSYATLIVLGGLSAAVLALLMGEVYTWRIFANGQNEIFRKFDVVFRVLVGGSKYAPTTTL